MMICPQCKKEVPTLGKLPEKEIMNLEVKHNWVCEDCFRKLEGDEKVPEDFNI